MTLDFTIAEASDNLSVIITDTTADYTGVEPNGQIQDVFDNGTATITLTILGTVYDAIDIKSYFDGGLQAGLIFVITADLLEVGSVAQFAAGAEMPDGDYTILYSVDDGGGDSDTETQQELVYGVIEKEVLDILRITNVFPLTFEETLKDAMIRLAHYSYLQSIINSAFVSEIDNLRVALVDLDAMVINGNY